MKLASIEYPFKLLTPAMVGGAEGKAGSAEMRIASIRGQIRQWHRKAAFMPECDQVWGRTEGVIIASRVSLTLAPHQTLAHRNESILPHKQSAKRDAIDSDQSFNLIVRRLVGCPPDHWETAQKATKLWLLLGCLGLRSNRAAGSVWPIGDWVPNDETSLKVELTRLGYTHPVRIVSTARESTAADLRKVASDTVNGSHQYFGSINPRTSSPLKIKVIRLSEGCRLLLTGLDATQFADAKAVLGIKPLGRATWTTP